MNERSAAIDVSIVIPAFNEGQNIERLEESLFPVVAELERRMRVEVVIVDDGSSDDTAEQLTQLAARHAQLVVVPHRHNQGLGAALRTGFAAARGAWIVTANSDGTYRFSEIGALLARRTRASTSSRLLRITPRAASRTFRPTGLVLSRGASTLYRLIVGGHIHTYTALFRSTGAK